MTRASEIERAARALLATLNDSSQGEQEFHDAEVALNAALALRAEDSSESQSLVAHCEAIATAPDDGDAEPVALDYETEHAIIEAHEIHASDEYFAARSHLLDTKVNRNCFEAGFKAAVRQGSELAEAVRYAEQFRNVSEQIASPPSPDRTQGDMPEFANLRQANLAMEFEWCGDAGINFTSLGFKGLELAGEAGELCNVLKKIERERLGMKGSRATLEDAKQELGDVIICCDLIAAQLGIDLWEAARDKFNAVAEKHGFKVRLASPTPQAASPVSTGADAKDAARYRWLRGRSLVNGRWPDGPIICKNVTDVPSMLREGAADHDIDAAMSDEAGKV